jgi:assimilatory nitrate reductase catalytic subunit
VPAALAEVTNAHGRAVLRVLVSDRVRPGHPFAPMHWTAQTAPSGRIDVLVPSAADPISGQPALKSAAVAIRPFAAGWFGYALATRPLSPTATYWATAPVDGGWQAELAGTGLPDSAALAAELFGHDAGQPVTSHDPARGTFRLAWAGADGLLSAALFLSRGPVEVARAHLTGLLSRAPAALALAGRPGDGQPDPGPQVCACLGVGAQAILRAAADCGTVAGIGAATGAGTGCGSCRPEIAALLARAIPKEAAE